MIFEEEQARRIAVELPWVDFVVDNTDITTALNDAPLSVRRVSPGCYVGKIFGVAVRTERLERSMSQSRGRIRSLAEVRLPFGLGQTHTVATHVLTAIDEQTTLLELRFRLETTGLASTYVRVQKKRVNDYIDDLCMHFENAATMLALEDERVDILLDEGQRARAAEWRDHVRRMGQSSSVVPPEIEASLRLSLVQDTVLVEAEARMPDRQLLVADCEVSDNKHVFGGFIEAATQLASINNPAFALRGAAPAQALDVNFRELAVAFGHRLYNKYFSHDLREVMPILINGRETTDMRLDVDEDLEGLPWEALNDGRVFLALSVRLARSIGPALHDSDRRLGRAAGRGVLLVGADSRGDLPGAELEVGNIARILSEAGVNAVKVLTGANASRRRVLDELSDGDFGILHFSGHSEFDSEHPYQSSLELGQGSRLRLHELDDLLRARGNATPLSLVFLNSCESAQAGYDRTSDRHLNMCRVLRECGVDHVVGMLWKVDDEAATKVASTFYSLVTTNERMDVAEAMRQTRCTVASDRAWADGSWLAPVLYA